MTFNKIFLDQCSKRLKTEYMGKRKSNMNYSVVFSVGSCNRLAAFPLILLIKFGTCHYILKNRQ